MAGFPARVRLALIPLITARLKTLSGRAVGVAALKGAFFLIVKAAMKDGTEADFRRWLTSRNPNVRALGLTCLCLWRPDDLEAIIAPLKEDMAKVRIRPMGNVESEQTLAQLAKRLLADPTYFGHRSQLRS